jgi:hypothetical protein
MSDEADKKRVDWELIEKDYRAGIKTLRQIGDSHGVTHAAVNKRAKKHCWERNVAQPRHEDRSLPVVDLDGEDRKFCTPGFVYVIFVHTGSDFFYKIGLAVNVDSRLKSHQTSNPFEVRLAMAYFVNNMRQEEAVLHAMFSDKLVRGEWYKLERSDLELIAKRSLLA